MPGKMCIHCYVAGKVQGVWFRASTHEKAIEFGVTGWVRNLPDGRVEVLACGDRDKIAQLHAWLKHGPKHANVTDLSYEELPWEEHDRFEVK